MPAEDVLRRSAGSGRIQAFIYGSRARFFSKSFFCLLWVRQLYKRKPPPCLLQSCLSATLSSRISCLYLERGKYSSAQVVLSRSAIDYSYRARSIPGSFSVCSGYISCQNLKITVFDAIIWNCNCSKLQNNVSKWTVKFTKQQPAVSINQSRGSFDSLVITKKKK